MTRYLLDTNHAGSLLKDENAALWQRLKPLSRADCFLCRPVVAELWYMVFDSARVDANRAKLEALIAQFDVAEFDAAAAMEFGRIRTELRRAATPIPMFDILIASVARAHGLTVLTADAHFQQVQGLTVEKWIS